MCRKILKLSFFNLFGCFLITESTKRLQQLWSGVPLWEAVSLLQWEELYRLHGSVSILWVFIHQPKDGATFRQVTAVLMFHFHPYCLRAVPLTSQLIRLSKQTVLLSVFLWYCFSHKFFHLGSFKNQVGEDRPSYCMYLYECVTVHGSFFELLHERKSSAAGLNSYIPHDISISAVGLLYSLRLSSKVVKIILYMG